MVRRGMATSRTLASELIAQGRVRVNGSPADKPARQVAPQDDIVVASGERVWASRGAHKLLGALDHFGAQGLRPPQGRSCLDAGASTGGFTDVLLDRDAARVVAADVGYGQLVWRLSSDDRVTVLDRTNIRHITSADLPYRPDLVVADLSFISLRTVLPALVELAAADADFVLMVKPQFEVGRERLGAGGVVRSPQLRAESVVAVCRSAEELGIGCAAVVASPLPGPQGNVEFFVWLRADAGPVSEDVVVSAVEEGPQ